MLGTPFHFMERCSEIQPRDNVEEFFVGKVVFGEQILLD